MVHHTEVSNGQTRNGLNGRSRVAAGSANPATAHLLLLHGKAPGRPRRPIGGKNWAGPPIATVTSSGAKNGNSSNMTDGQGETFAD